MTFINLKTKDITKKLVLKYVIKLENNFIFDNIKIINIILIFPSMVNLLYVLKYTLVLSESI